MKKRIGLLAVLMSAIMAFAGFAGCMDPLSGGGGGTDWSKPIDNTKTQVKVFNYNGGVGDAWLASAITRFEEAYKDEVFETGKTGVQIDVTSNTHAQTQLDNIRNNNHSVFFMEGVRFNTLQNENKLLNITDIVTATDLEGADSGVSIESKMNANTKAALKSGGEYYVLPHYQSLNGLTFNRSLFDEKNLYFAKNEADYASTNPADATYGFIKNASAEKTCGPNGISGDYDDGLPSSLEELERLCEVMVKVKSCIPFAWYGKGASYQTAFVTALWASLEGYDGAMANFLFDSNGKEVEIVTGFDGSGNPQTSKVVVNEYNWRDVYKQKSRYDALEFARKVFQNSKYYHVNSTDGDTYSHIAQQELFLESYLSGDDRPVAMLLEGSYWENEAKTAGTLNSLKKSYPATFNELKYEFMPLPVQATGSVPENTDGIPNPTTTVDALDSYAFINANVRTKYGEGVERAAKAFLKFLYTDASLKEFTVKSGVTKNLTYTLGEAKNELSYFTKSVIDIFEKSDVVTAISSESLARQYPNEFTLYPGGKFWESKVSGATYGNPFMGFSATSGNSFIIKTGRAYFDGLAKASNWPS